MFRHPAIQEACVISTKDDYRGESVKAVVVLRATHKDTTEQQIIDWCRENMAVYKVPRIVQFVPALPKSGSGKAQGAKGLRGGSEGRYGAFAAALRAAAVVISAPGQPGSIRPGPAPAGRGRPAAARSGG
eukprot:gene19254-38520_t